MKPNLLDRSMVVSPWAILLCTTPKMFLETQRRLGVKPCETRPYPTSGAQVSFFVADDYIDPTARKAMIVTIAENAMKNYEGIQVAAMLCHEAVHIVQRILRGIGESAPSDEFQAYSIQSVAQNLMYEYARQTA
jgi:hypothetical protein